MSNSNDYEAGSSTLDTADQLFLVRTDRGIMGPITKSALEEMIRTGAVGEGDSINKYGETAWIGIGKSGFFARFIRFGRRRAFVDELTRRDKDGVVSFFFHVSLLKFSIMSLFTLQLYSAYWFYKHWSIIRARENSGINPWLRTLLADIYSFSLFNRIIIQSIYVNKNIDVRFAKYISAACAIYFVATSLYTYYIPDKDLLYLFIPFPTFVLLAIQREANFVNNALTPRYERNSRLTLGNWIWIGVGGIFIALAVVGVFIPPEE